MITAYLYHWSLLYGRLRYYMRTPKLRWRVSKWAVYRQSHWKINTEVITISITKTDAAGMMMTFSQFLSTVVTSLKYAELKLTLRKPEELPV